ncbi:MAG: hypothetical protein QOD91_2328, partial [Frankiales bacterium]|nr:hypothetical protein [Frankiales bacterium]
MLARTVFGISRGVGGVSRLAGLGAGTTVPGRVATLLHPHALETLSRNRAVALISGTNGKTTVTAFLTAALSDPVDSDSPPVATNATGSNLEAGLVTALLGRRANTAALEVDEVVLPQAIAACRPAVVVLLNLSRDQLDRTSEVQIHANRWAEALRTTRAWVVANADDPLVVHAVTQARPGGDRVGWVAAGQPWRADSVLCPSCHRIWDLRPLHWSCRHCGLSRPNASWELADDLLRTPTGALLPLKIALPGRPNLGNAAMAVAAAAALGVPADRSSERLRRVRTVAGRYNVGVVGGRRLRLLLAKNPAGWAVTLDELGRSDDPVIVAINARRADGLDSSWLWDVPFE